MGVYARPAGVALFVIGLSVCGGAAQGGAVQAGSAQAGSSVVVALAGEAYDGPPAFEVRMGDSTLGSGVLTKAIDTEKAGRIFTDSAPLDYVQKFTYSIPSDEYAANKPIRIRLTNDRFKAKGDGLDRNIFVQYIEVNGLRFKARDLTLMHNGKEVHVDFQAGMMPIYEGGTYVVANAPDSGWPSGEVTSATSKPGKQAAAHAGDE